MDYSNAIGTSTSTDELATFLEGYRLTPAAYCVLVYDWIITLDDEVRQYLTYHLRQLHLYLGRIHVERQVELGSVIILVESLLAMSSGSAIFFFASLFCIFERLLRSCALSYTWFIWSTLFSHLVVTSIFIRRIHAMYDRNAKVLLAMIIAEVMLLLAQTVLSGLISSNARLLPASSVSGCVPGHWVIRPWIYWIPAGVLEIFLFSLVLVKSLRCMIGIETHNPALLILLFRDSIFYFGGMSIILVANVLMWTIGTDALFVALSEYASVYLAGSCIHPLTGRCPFFIPWSDVGCCNDHHPHEKHIMASNYTVPPPSYSGPTNKLSSVPPEEEASQPLLSPRAGSSSAIYDQPQVGDVPDDFKYGTTVSECALEIRNAFVRKVYTILFLQILGTCIVGGLISRSENAVMWVATHQWSFYVPLFGTLINLGLLYWKRHSHPTNFILLSTFTLMEAFTLALLITLGVFLGLTLFTFQSKYDFSGMGPWLFGGLIALLMTGLVGIFIPFSRTTDLVFAIGGCLLFSGYVVYDTYLINNRVSPDEYIMAAISLYLDFINLFISILRILNNTQDR
ncbi:hypothetical protein NM688_g2807 [Phlebia brevispora]|uniref:Uncharacterized protein n=1 Tax=Phlebia brevispora TaxID=194682 RepID=A0ACC1T7N7_9APHY|nr:hypothetical protein NM688_g2807 [Phlebia brevispora]